MYIGIDSSLNGTGLCVYNPETNEYCTLTIKPKKLRGAARLAYIYATAKTFFLAYTGYKQAAIEGYSYGSVGKLAELGEVGGILRLLLHELNVPYIVVAPSALKKFVSNDSSAEKIEMLAAVTRNWGVKLTSDNEADAVGLAKVSESFLLGNASTRTQLEVVNTLKTPKKKKKSIRRSKTLSI